MDSRSDTLEIFASSVEPRPDGPADRGVGHLAGRARRRICAAGPLAALLGLTVLSACGERSGTEPSTAPAELVVLSPTVDTVVAGESADPPLSVRVTSPLGDPIEGIPVRFLVISGPGSVDALAVSNRQGVAEAEFRTTSEIGASRVRADIPSAVNVRPVEFRILVLPASEVRFTKRGGDAQEAERGSQLPLPFELEARTPGGAAAGGVTVAWRIVAPDGGSGRLTADTTFTDPEGRTRVLLTLGDEETEYVVAAHAAGAVASDTVRFTARATALPVGPVRLDSVRPLPLRAGEEAVAFGAGFEPAAAANEVRVEGEPAVVLESDGTRIRFRVPDFGDTCLPARTVGIRILVGSNASNGDLVELRPREPSFDLTPGEAVTIDGPEALRCVQLPAAESGRELWVAVQSASRTATATTPLRLLTLAGTSGGQTRISASLLSVEAEAARQVAREEGGGSERLLRQSVREEIRRRRLSPVALGPDSRLPAARREVPAAGDTVELRFAVRSNLAATCADTANRVAGVVKAVGDGVVLAVDVEAPTGGFTDDEWASLADEFDAFVLPTDVAYFGSPADIDGNGRILLLFTPKVNQLTPEGSGSLLGGFFLALDLAASGRGGAGAPPPVGQVCPASNEGEILYAVVPDPEGLVGDPLTKAQALRILREVLAHELQHLINAERRVLGSEQGFGALEESWLDEGLSHVAEEVNGLVRLGLPVRSNLEFETVAGSREALDVFNAFHIVNFFNASLFLFDPAGAPTLSATDPGGLGGIQMRGWAWLFLRWLADQEGGVDERVFFRDLVAGGASRVTGTANVERATGRPWERLLADFAATLPLDDAGVDPVSDRHRITTWNLRSVFEGLSRNPSARRRFPVPFPLGFTALGFENAAVDLELRGSTLRYIRLEGGIDTPALALSLLSAGGGAAPREAAPQITIVRTR